MILQKKSDEIPILTIAYATYNRREIVRKRLIEILNTDFSSEVEIIFIDNDSTDGTYNELKNLNANNKFSIYKNDYNVGFGGNFIEVLKRSNGEFAIWVSDEDSIDLQKISNILKVLKEKKPDVLVLNHFKKIDNSLYPIRLNRSKLINETNLWDVCHLPGNIWKRKSVELIYTAWNFYQENYPQLSRYYPNLLLMIYLIPKRKCYFLNNYLTFQKDFMKSSHKAPTSYSYPNLIPRWLQHNEILKFISHLIEDNKYENKLSLLKIKKSLNKNIFVLISNAIYEENKEIYYYFARSFYPSYIIKRNFNFLLIATKFILWNPVISFQVIKKRLKAFYNNK